MTTMIANYVGKKFFGETLQNNFGQEDPYFERVPATRLNGRPSKKGKKRRKALPPGISEHDGKVLTKVKRRAYYLDMSLCNCCGIRFGWSSVIGIIPGFGDVIDAMMAIMVMRTCGQIEGGLPTNVRMKMYLNIILDFAVGLVPFLGDLADALFRANTRNAVVLEKHLREKGAKTLKAQGASIPDTDPTDPDEFDRQMSEEHGPPPPYSGAAAGQGQTQSSQSQDLGSRQTQSAHTQGHESRGGGWMGGKKKQPDLEAGRDIPMREQPRAPPMPPRPSNGS